MIASQVIRQMSLPQRNLPVVEEADVVVAGGGNAGFIAAVAAEAAGAQRLAAGVELLVLAQASMTRLAPRLGIEYTRRVLDGLPEA